MNYDIKNLFDIYINTLINYNIIIFNQLNKYIFSLFYLKNKKNDYIFR
jgi:hypothetical protein